MLIAYLSLFDIYIKFPVELFPAEILYLYYSLILVVGS
jgi:hypothetical protein